jgi:hypothetical protein
MICEVANEPTAMQKRSAAAVMIRPVRSSPTATSRRVQKLVRRQN